MAYKFFDKKFLVMPSDKDIIGKKVFYNDVLYDLIAEVEKGDFNCTAVLDNIDDYKCCFEVDSTHWSLVYHDPNYEAKVAYSQGKQVQFKSKVDGAWGNCGEEPNWDDDYEYRVKPGEVWYVHQDIDGHYWKSDSDTITVEFKGTEAECDAWIAEHTQKTRRMMNKELARWLAEGNGQKATINGNVISYHSYELDDANKEVEDCMIREWDSDEWHEPLVEVTDAC